jgi:hypothetical protein
MTAALAVSIAATLLGTPVVAQNWGDLLTGIINAAIVDAATKKWQRIDADVQQCYITRYNGAPQQLAQQGIGPDDSRVASFINSCEQLVAQARLQQQQDEQRRLAEAQSAEAARQAEAQRVAGERRAEEQQIENQRLADEEAAKRAQREQEAAETAEKAKQAAHHQALVKKFGTELAVAIETGLVRKGMTMEAVLEARGQPSQKERIPPDAELWTYGADRISFVKGKVTYVGH